jgi:DNA-binding PadR family transcriptional regulator
MMALSSDILRGYTDTILLNCLSGGDSYGYQMIKEISQLSNGALVLKEPTLYTAFRRLTQDGLIESYWGDEQSGARRRYYRLTGKGLERLSEDQQAWRETRRVLDTLLLDENE